jgi:hypothetical protein
MEEAAPGRDYRCRSAIDIVPLSLPVVE